MRTSYQRTNNVKKPQEPEDKNVGSVQDNIDLEDEALKASLRDAYIAINDAVVDSRKKQEIKEYSEALEAQADSVLQGNQSSEPVYGEEDQGSPKEDNEETSKEEKALLEKQRKKRKKVIIGTTAASIAVVAVAGFLIYRNFFAPDSSVEAIQTRISKLYTSENMVDIKEGVTQDDLNEFYLELLDVQNRGDDVESAMEELDTIGYFLSDKSTLERYDSESYDLTTAGMMDSVEDIKENAQGYSVPGLALTINDMAMGIEDDYDYFIDLRSDLNGVVDVLSFDESGYNSKISMVSHIPNRTELEATYDKIVVDKQAAVAQQELQEAQDEQAKQEAQKALEEAQELQRQTQKELEETRKQLEEAAQKAAEEEQQRETLDSNPIATPTAESTEEAEPTVTDTPTEESSSLEDQVDTQSVSKSSETVESTSGEE